MANKKVIRYNPNGDYVESEICTGDPVEFGHLQYAKEEELEQPHDDCPACEENLFYTSEITKRIAILDNDKNVSGWVCPSCYTEFNTRDEVLILMSSSSVQGKA